MRQLWETLVSTVVLKQGKIPRKGTDPIGMNSFLTLSNVLSQGACGGVSLARCVLHTVVSSQEWSGTVRSRREQ